MLERAEEGERTGKRMGNCITTTAGNCCLSCILLSYAAKVGGIKKLQNQFAFAPPDPPSYSLDEAGALLWSHDLLRAEADSVKHLAVDTSVTQVRNRFGNTVTIFRYQPRASPAGERRRLTLLWSHGNAMDCGELFAFHAHLALRFDVDVVSYDYSGYGASSGQPSEHALNADMEAVHEHLSTAWGVDASRELVVYGQSVGSGPSCRIAVRRPCAALVLHAPIASGIRVIAPDCTPTPRRPPRPSNSAQTQMSPWGHALTPPPPRVPRRASRGQLVLARARHDVLRYLPECQRGLLPLLPHAPHTRHTG